jgi:hypothetical protein
MENRTINKARIISKPDGTKAVYDKNVHYLFKKHNFCVECFDNVFRAFSYEANYTKDSKVNIIIKDATNNRFVRSLEPTIDRIAQKAITDLHGNHVELGSIPVVTYEEFCDALFGYICAYISQDETLGDTV